MTQKEKKLISRFLEDLGDILDKRSCNDWKFPLDWTRDEKIAFIKEYYDFNGDPENFDEQYLYLSDTAVVSLLSYKNAIDK